MANEILSEEQLNEVSGGTAAASAGDRSFFSQLSEQGYNVSFQSFGWKVTESADGNNIYEIWDKTGTGFKKYYQRFYRWIALSDVLYQIHYSGFDDNKMFDEKYVESFINSNFTNVNTGAML